MKQLLSLGVLIVALILFLVGYFVWADSFTYEIDSTIETSEELPGLSGGAPRRVGTMINAEGEHDDFALDEIVMTFREQNELDTFLKRYNGSVIRSGMSQSIEGLSPPDYNPTSNDMYLIQVDLDRSSLEDLVSNMEDAKLSGRFTFSSEEAARLIAILARERKLPIMPNVLLRGGDVREHPGPSGFNLDAETWTWMTEDDDANTPENEGLSVGVIHAWEYLSYMGVPPFFDSGGGSAEWRPTYVAIIDGGFALDETTGVPLNGNTDYFYYGAKPIQVDMVDYDGTAGGENRTRCSGGNPCPWHGQGAFGVVGATPRNRFGSAGIGGPVVVPILVKVDWTWYGAVEGMYTLADAIRASVLVGQGSKGADVISVSISGGCFTICGITEFGLKEDFNDYMQRAVLTATSFGAVVVAAAGNESWDLDNTKKAVGSEIIPCELEQVICVGAVGEDKKAMDYSNYGSNVDIWAPTHILSTTSPSHMAIDDNETCNSRSNTSCDELYRFGGTSAATPFVAGVIALMTALDKNVPSTESIPTAGIHRVEEIQRILGDTANDSCDPNDNCDPKVSPGYVDAYQAVSQVRRNTAPTVTVTTPKNGATVSWREATSYFQVEVIDLEPGADRPQFVGKSTLVVSSDTDGEICSVASRYRGQTTYYCDRPVQSLGKHTIMVTATDPFGASSTTAVVEIPRLRGHQVYPACVAE